uniref:EF-hand domain-containing protein n=1 Tax=Castor canadensis TaxID=51338 RepID=A0A8C0ZZ75_CASCN
VSSGTFNVEQIEKKMDGVNERFENVQNLTVAHHEKLKEAFALFQFFQDLDTEESWIQEKLLRVSSQDYGRDLQSVQNLLRKHRRLGGELLAHKDAVQKVLEMAEILRDKAAVGQEEIQKRLAQFVQHWEKLKELDKARGLRLEESLQFLQFLENVEEEEAWISEKEAMVARGDSGDTLAATENLLKKHEALDTDFAIHKTRVQNVCVQGEDILKKIWKHLPDAIKEREHELQKEEARQVKNFEMCQEFEQNASAFLQWIQETRSLLKEKGTLESQLEANKRKQKEIQAMKRQLTKIEDLGDNMEEALILDIKYSTIGLAQQWDQLHQLGMRMQHNLEQQIQAKDTIGVSEETLKEFSTTYKHFDENLTGRLTHKEFRSCLRGLNYYLPMVEDDEPEPRFQKFLDAVDPGRKGYVSLEDYTSFLIDKESENIKTSDDIESAFQALAEGKAYITKEDMKQALTPEQVSFCTVHMQQYMDPRGRGHPAGYDYVGFTNSYFGN